MENVATSDPVSDLRVLIRDANSMRKLATVCGTEPSWKQFQLLETILQIGAEPHLRPNAAYALKHLLVRLRVEKPKARALLRLLQNYLWTRPATRETFDDVGLMLALVEDLERQSH